MSYTPEQFDRLPKWARQRITLLEKNLAHAEETIRGQEDAAESEALLNPYSEGQSRPLGKDVIVRFGREEGTHFTVKYDAVRGTLDVMGVARKYGDQMVVMPRGGNVVEIGHAGSTR